MRIEALKLARQIALASRSRQDAKVPVCRCSALPSGNAVCATGSQGCFANHWPGGHCGCPMECDFSEAESVTLAQTHPAHMCGVEGLQPAESGRSPHRAHGIKKALSELYGRLVICKNWLVPQDQRRILLGVRCPLSLWDKVVCNFPVFWKFLF